MRYVLRPRARQDLDDIWDHTVAAWNSEQAEAYIRQIVSAFERLADRPQLGLSVDEVRAGFRKFRTGSHVVFYRALDEGIEIVRVLHQRMDVGKHL